MADIWDKEKRSKVMSKIRGKNTKPELILRKAIFRLGYRYRIHKKDLPGKPDIVLIKYKTVIFVHGCFWHYHNKCNEGRIPNSNSEYWKTKLEKNIFKDKNNIKILKRNGWKVFVFWECEIEKNLDSILIKLTKRLI